MAPSCIHSATSATFLPSLFSSLCSLQRVSCSIGRNQLLLGSRRLLVSSAWHKRQRWLPEAPRAVQAEVKDKESEQQKDTEETDSDYESSDDEGNYGFVSNEPEVPTVSKLLQLYKEALLNNNETGLTDVESKLLSLEKDKDALTRQISTLTDEVATLKDRAIRLSAEFDNFRKRSERDRIAVGTNVKGDIVGSLLPMIDNFERAKAQIKITSEGEQRIDDSYQGIYKQFLDIMKGLGVSLVETIGKEFNPSVHEAIMQEESSEFSEGVVMEEFRRGFLLGEKLLRPAMVKVSSGAPAVPDANAAAVPDTNAAAAATNGSPALEQSSSGVCNSQERVRVNRAVGSNSVI